MKVKELREAGFILDIVVDMTHLDEGVKAEYLKRKNTEQENIDKHLNVTGLKYDKITNITFVMAELDEDIKKEYKILHNSPMPEIVAKLSRLCDKTPCSECPYGSGLYCKLKDTDDFPYRWQNMLD